MIYSEGDFPAPKSDRVVLNQALARIFREALWLGWKNPRQFYFLLRALRRQKQAARLRQKWKASGMEVPPALMVSITDQCNLQCQGCFPRGWRSSAGAEMSALKLKGLFAEARELGIAIIMIFGGEPLVRPEILRLIGDYPEIIFLLFTNGVLVDRELLEIFRKQRNLVPVLSLEGGEEETDARRGRGVHEHLLRTMGGLKKRDIFFGASFTLTRSNFMKVTDGEWLHELLHRGCRLFFFVEYIQVAEGPLNWPLSSEQRRQVRPRIDFLRAQFPGLFFAFPGSEEKFGGCLAGRAFVHISSQGIFEPCPFVPARQPPLGDVSLKEALKSESLLKLRSGGEALCRSLIPNPAKPERKSYTAPVFTDLKGAPWHVYQVRRDA